MGALRGHLLVESASVNKLMISVLPYKLNEDDTFEGTESDEMSMDTLEMVNDDQCSSSVMEIETAIAIPVREVETGTNPDLKSRRIFRIPGRGQDGNTCCRNGYRYGREQTECRRSGAD
jgi:hypothetical protein